jgi:hypothetical protein
MPWSARFEDPIPLPNGRQRITLKDAATHITKLPKAEHAVPEWQGAMQALILVAEHDESPSAWAVRYTPDFPNTP